MAVENDYDLLVRNLDELAKTITSLRDEVERRRLLEAREGRAANDTDWVNLIGLDLMAVEHIFNHLRSGVAEVLESKTGEAVFAAEPPPPPDTP